MPTKKVERKGRIVPKARTPLAATPSNTNSPAAIGFLQSKRRRKVKQLARRAVDEHWFGRRGGVAIHGVGLLSLSSRTDICAVE